MEEIIEIVTKLVRERGMRNILLGLIRYLDPQVSESNEGEEYLRELRDGLKKVLNKYDHRYD